MKSKITAIKAGRNPRIQRSNIFLDGRFAFSLDNEVIVKESLKVGLELSPAEVSLLTEADQFHRCLNAAFQFLSFRPRSEAETRTRLQRRGYDVSDIERVIAQLKRLGLLDDAAFAEFWKDNRNSFRPRSQRMLRMELRQKGVESGLIDEVIGGLDEAGNAYRAAVDRSRSLPALDYQVFRQKLGGYLQRRGFSFGVINNVVKQVWQERSQNAALQSDFTEDTGVADF